jgi:hypothetical protein
VQIKYSKHLEHRLVLRKMEHDLPRKIFEQSDERYFDEETGYSVATMKAGQKENRVNAGRWRKIHGRV